MPKAKQELAPTPQGGALATADQMDFLASRSGQGTERVGMADIIMPRVNILQSLSPQINARKPEFVEGAKEGQLFNAATRQFMDKLRVLPCHYIRHHIEWLPNRGGFVADHGEDDRIMKSIGEGGRVKGRNEQKYDVLDNGNLIVPTPTWYCLDLDHGGQQIVIPMPRTQSKASRSWMSQATSERVNPRDTDPTDTRDPFQPPLFYRSWDLGSVIREDGENDWFVFTVNPGPNIFQLKQPELMSAAARFRDMLVSGEIKASAESFADDTGGDSRSDRGGDGGAM
jgi:hypothetical protein